MLAAVELGGAGDGGGDAQAALMHLYKNCVLAECRDCVVLVMSVRR